MGSVYRKQVTRPMPKNAKVIIRAGQQLAQWIDRAGKKQSAPVANSKDGSLRIRVESGCYIAKYRDGDGLLVERSTGCKQRQNAEAWMRERMTQAEKVKAGILSTPELRAAKAQSEAIDDHLAVYLIHLQAKGDGRRHIEDCERLIARLTADCAFIRLGDIDRDAVESWLVTNATEGMGARTRNTYLQALRGFCQWCVATRRMVANPLAGIQRANEKSDRRRQRRAMTESELRDLLYVARWRPIAEFGRETVRRDDDDMPVVAKSRRTWKQQPLSIQTLPEAIERSTNKLADNPAFLSKLDLRGQERALVYKFAVLTGLRRGELASLTIGQVDLAAGYVALEAADEKNRQGSTLPLRSDLVADLELWLSAKLEAYQEQALPMVRGRSAKLPPNTPLFSVPVKLVKSFNRDLAAAGIAKADDRGRVLDIHALRHSFGTLLSTCGVSPRTAQQAMRHSSIDLTMNVYTDARLLDVVGAVESLPAFSIRQSRTRQAI